MTSRPLRQQHRIHYHHNGRAVGSADLTMGPGNPKLVLSLKKKMHFSFCFLGLAINMPSCNL